MYAVIADAHLGKLEYEHEKLLFDELNNLRKEGLKIIWLGDTFDLIWKKTSYSVYNKVIEDGDIVIIGNHDFSLIKDNVGVREFVLGNTALVHGDYLDFGLFITRLEHFWYNLKRLDISFFEILAKLLYPGWKFSDVHDMFLLMENIDRKILEMFSHDPKYKHNIFVEFFTILKLVKKAKKYLRRNYIPLDVHNPKPPLPTTTKRGSIFGYFTFDPNELYKRYKHLYKEELQKKNIIIGHIHKPADTIVENETRFVIVGSWKKDLESGVYPTVPLIDTRGDIIEIREYK